MSMYHCLLWTSRRNEAERQRERDKQRKRVNKRIDHGCDTYLSLSLSLSRIVGTRSRFWCCWLAWCLFLLFCLLYIYCCCCRRSLLQRSFATELKKKERGKDVLQHSLFVVSLLSSSSSLSLDSSNIFILKRKKRIFIAVVREWELHDVSEGHQPAYNFLFITSRWYYSSLLLGASCVSRSSWSTLIQQLSEYHYVEYFPVYIFMHAHIRRLCMSFLSVR